MSAKKFQVSLGPLPGHSRMQSDQESDLSSQETSVCLVDEHDIEAANESAAEGFATGATSRTLSRNNTSGSSGCIIQKFNPLSTTTMSNIPPVRPPDEKSGGSVAAPGASSRRALGAARNDRRQASTSSSPAVQNSPDIGTGISAEGLLDTMPALVNPMEQSQDSAQPTASNDQVAHLDSSQQMRNKPCRKKSKKKHGSSRSHSSSSTILSHSGADHGTSSDAARDLAPGIPRVAEDSARIPRLDSSHRRKKNKERKKSNESSESSRSLSSSATLTRSGMESIHASDVARAQAPQPPEITQAVKNSDQAESLDSSHHGQQMDRKKCHRSHKSPRELSSPEALAPNGMEDISASDVAPVSVPPSAAIARSANHSNEDFPLDSNPSEHKEHKNCHHPKLPPSSPTLTLEDSGASLTNEVEGERNVNITPPSLSEQSARNQEVESDTRPGAFAVLGREESNDGGTVQTGGEAEPVIVSADPVGTPIEEQLRERISELEMEREQMEAERNQIVDAAEVRLENNRIGVDEGKQRIVRWATVFVVLLVVVLAIVLGVVFGRRGTTTPPTPAPATPPTLAPTDPPTDPPTPAPTDPPTPAPTDPPTPAPTTTAPPTPAPTSPPTPAPTTPPDPEILRQLVVLFSNTSPATATSLQDATSNQYRAMEWLTKDVEENGFDLSTYENRILARGALAILFYSTNGDGWWKSTGWLDHGVSECDWDSVICSLGIVTKLYLREDNLVGTLLREIHLLTGLEYLNVAGNSIRGTIATEIAGLTNLRWLSLWGNQFTRTLPSEFGLLTNLEWLSVSSNSLTGTVPTELGELKKLETLQLYNNEFTGQVPSQVCALDSLTYLWADCKGSPPEIECTCCTMCCTGAFGTCVEV